VKLLALLIFSAAPLVAQEIPKAPPNLFFPAYQPPTFQVPAQTPPSLPKTRLMKPPITLMAQVGQPKVCAIPLLNFAPKGNYTMKAIPTSPNVDPKIVVKPPAPACGE
jgi:hypothetical protein